MKKMIFAAFAVLVLCAGSASAESEYSVKKGDNLTKIAHRYEDISARDIFAANPYRIKNINLIYPGQKLRIPEPGTQPWDWNFVLRNPYKGTLEQGLSELGFYDPGMEYALAVVSRTGNYDNVYINKGTMVPATIFGRSIVKKNVRINWAGWAKVYTATVETDNVTRTCKLLYPECGNPTPWYCEEQPKTPPEPAPPVPAPPEPILPPVGEEIPKLKIELKLPPVEKPAIRLPGPEKKPAFTWPEAGCCPPEHEPIIGAGIWGNGIAQGNWYYAEYMAWLKANCDSEYSYGVGFYLNGEDGDSKLSAYEWWGFGAGPQVGIKRYWFYTDNTVGDDNTTFLKERPQQWSVKARLIWETLHGSNPESGYMNRQNDLKAGIYAEYVRQMSDRWLGSLTGEGWYNFNRRLTTTWKGDTPSNRTQISLGAFAQYKLNDTWQVRFGGGPFYQGWDHLTGLHARAELRYKEVLMFGPYANLFPWKTSVYEGIPLHKLQTVGAFVRVEFGPIIRDLDERRRRERVQRFKRDPAREVALASTAMASGEENVPSDVNIIETSAEVDVDKIAEPVIVLSQAERDEYDRLDRLASEK